MYVSKGGCVPINLLDLNWAVVLEQKGRSLRILFVLKWAVVHKTEKSVLKNIIDLNLAVVHIAEGCGTYNNSLFIF